MKINELIQETIQNYLEESPLSIEDENGKEIYYQTPGTYSFALNKKNNEVYVGEESVGHSSSYFDVDGENVNLRNAIEGKREKTDIFQFPGRLFSMQKTITFWNYPERNQMYNILKGLQTKLPFKFWDGTWKIEIRNEDSYDYIPVEQYISSKNVSDLEGKLHTMGPVERAKYKQLYRYLLKLDPKKITSEQKEDLKILRRVFGATGGGSIKLAKEMPLAYRQAIQTSESANIFEQVEKILKEWTEDQKYDIYEMRNEIMYDTLEDFMTKPVGAKQPWTLVPFGRLKKIWEDAYKTGVVRDEKGLDMIQARMIKNLLKLDVNTEILGHSIHLPEDEIEDLGYTMEQFEEKMEDYNGVYFNDDNGQYRLSDYGLEPLWKIAQKLVEEDDDSRRIMYIDQMLNVIHMRSDMAGNFVEGGSSALSQLSGEHAELV